eukprot:CAMPEP_0201548988 /NCGR_PEP_ID=MMETSP0173_2-20130828/5467_1 /ASSEMBLY_ACC=CAM_ASM_000268 /TAXON_ID=218659 /ORGANISM="Vexillifera sp., Strain DIVA3 564/2" /LENGTH=114 /DNA_ID=CAMNT_0047958513 /DNA_START=71 /DNA_END=415 /DNA_ORIENTATION=+
MIDLDYLLHKLCDAHHHDMILVHNANQNPSLVDYIAYQIFSKLDDDDVQKKSPTCVDYDMHISQSKRLVDNCVDMLEILEQFHLYSHQYKALELHEDHYQQPLDWLQLDVYPLY